MTNTLKATPFKEGKRCINICAHCGEPIVVDGIDFGQEINKVRVTPILPTMKIGGETVNVEILPQVTTRGAGGALRVRGGLMAGVPVRCRGCGAMPESTLALKTLDIVVILYY